MAKNLVIFFASPYRRDARAELYTDPEGRFSAACEQTNETALKYIGWRLRQSGEEIASAYAFVTNAVYEHDFRRLVSRFAAEKYAIKPIYFDERSTIDGSFRSINVMYELLLGEYRPEEEIVIHMDLTGGFRHSTVLMLDLLRLLKYSGYKIGMITYTNFNEHRIEVVNELVDMFDLISGAQDFTSNGSVGQLQAFFAHKQQSLSLQKLLKNMEHFSECIKSCSTREALLAAAGSLRSALAGYKAYLQANSSSVSEQERFFAGLLPTIEKEYAAIFACDNTTASIPKLIRWCLQKGLLQQAATYATELLPVYLVDSGLLTINDSTIIEECQRTGKSWSNWQVELLKNYNFKDFAAAQVTGLKKIDYTTLRLLLAEQHSAYKLKQLIGSKNPALEAFLNETVKLALNVCCDSRSLLQALKKLPDDNLLRLVVEKSKPSTCDLHNYVTKRLGDCQTIDRFILSCLYQLGKKVVNDWFFDSGEKTIAVKIEAGQGNDTARAQMFLGACRKGLLSTRLSEEALQQAIMSFLSIVKYRNSISHADGKTEGSEGNQSLRKLISDELDLLEQA